MKLKSPLFFVALALSAMAQAQENLPSLYVQPSVNLLRADQSFGVDRHGNGAGLNFGGALNADWDLQGGVNYARSRDNGQRYQQQSLGAQGLYLFSRDTFRPFILVGAGLQRERSNLSGNLVRAGNSPYLSAGLGFQAQLDPQWALQLDLRKQIGLQRNDIFPTDRSHNYYLTAALNYAFGGAPAAAPVVAPAPQALLVPAPLAPPPPAPQPPAPPPQVRFEKITLSATELFAFDSSQLKPEQRQLDEMASKLAEASSPIDLVVRGYTDRKGTPRYNQRLSQSRADAVKAYLVGRGVGAEHITATGMGSANPVAACERERGAELIRCLEPNRRVEVEPVVIQRRIR